MRNELVFEKNGKPVTSSRLIASTFGKQHKDVLKAIRNIECSTDFRERNFAPIDNQRVTHSPVVKSYEYVITEQGFTMLVMGFTGSQAAKFKEEFINQFFDMRQKLSEKKPMSQLEMIAQSAQVLLEQQKQLESVREDQEKLKGDIDVNSERVRVLESKVDFANHMFRNGLHHTVAAAAKLIAYPDLGPQKMWQYLRARGWVYKSSTTPMQKCLKQGLLVMKRNKWMDKKTGELKFNTTTLVTEKGVATLYFMLHGYPMDRDDGQMELADAV